MTCVNNINKWKFIISRVFILFLFYGGFLSTDSSSLFFSLLFYRIIYIACCIAMVLISLKVCLIVFSSILSFSSKIFIEGIYVVALAPTVMTINGSTFHPLLVYYLQMVQGNNHGRTVFSGDLSLNVPTIIRI